MAYQRSIETMAFIYHGGARRISARRIDQFVEFHPATYSSVVHSSTAVSMARRTKRRQSQQQDEQFESSVLPIESAIDQVISIVSSPTPFSPAIALGYPIVLAILALFLPFSTWLLSCGLFLGFTFLGRRVLQEAYEDEDGGGENASNNVVSLVSLAGAVASAGLVSPEGGLAVRGSGGGQIFVQVIVVAVIGLSIASILWTGRPQEMSGLDKDDPPDLAEATSFDEELLKQWDRKFAKKEASEKDERTRSL
jgi:hypothetical protein